MYYFSFYLIHELLNLLFDEYYITDNTKVQVSDVYSERPFMQYACGRAVESCNEILKIMIENF